MKRILMRLTVPAFLFLLLTVCGLSAGAQQQQSSYGFLNLNGRSTRQSAVINWETIQELSITQFHVQRSRNGIDFETIGTADASHDTTLDRYQYQFTDANAAARGHMLYYRLEIAVNNGRMLYSKTFVIRFDESAETQLSIIPNLVRSTLPITVEGNTETGAQLRIIDLQGRILRSQDLQIVKGMTILSIDVSDLRPGGYIAVLSAPGVQLQQRFFRQQ